MQLIIKAEKKTEILEAIMTDKPIQVIPEISLEASLRPDSLFVLPKQHTNTKYHQLNIIYK